MHIVVVILLIIMIIIIINEVQKNKVVYIFPVEVCPQTMAEVTG